MRTTRTISVSILLLIATISGCSSFRKPPGPKLYDYAFVVIKSDATVVTTQAEENDVLRIAHLRLSEFTSDELSARGDLKAVQMCGPRTLKITEDIQSIGTESAVSVKHKLFWSRSTGEQHEDFRVSINTIVEDCVTGKRLESFTYDNHGIDLVAVLKTLASWNVSEAYRYQHGP
jgi:hypothetical protein